MKTKNLLFGLSIVLLLTWSFGQTAYTQNDTKEKKTVRHKIVKSMNGKTTTTDTTFEVSPPLDLSEGKELSFNFEDKTLKLQFDSVGENVKKLISIRTLTKCKDTLEVQRLIEGNLDSLLMNDKFNHIQGSLDDINMLLSKDTSFINNSNLIGNDNEDTDVQVSVNGDTIITKRVIKNMHKANDMGNGPTHKKIMIRNFGHTGNVDLQGDQGSKKTIMATMKIEDSAFEDSKQLKNSDLDADAENELKVESLSFEPNPSNGLFTLKFSLITTDKIQIKIFDINGKEVYSETLKDFNGSYARDIDISANGPGTYILKIIQSKKSVSKKIVVR